MKPKQTVKIAVDCAMLFLLPFLMAFEPLGRRTHEWLGAGMLALFLAHHLLNIQWYRGLKKGRWAGLRVLQTAVNILLLSVMLGAMISGMGMSRYVFDFLPIPGGRAMFRRIHMACVHWSFLLMGVHLGLHWGVFLSLGRKLRNGSTLSPPVQYLLRLLAASVSLYGVNCFIRENVVSYLFLQAEFAFFAPDKPLPLVILDLIAMLTLWAMMGYLLLKLSTAKRK